jgi:hypothetical protein
MSDGVMAGEPTGYEYTFAGRVLKARCRRIGGCPVSSGPDLTTEPNQPCPSSAAGSTSSTPPDLLVHRTLI